VVMIVMCVALMKDLRSDPLVRRGQRVTAAVEQAVDYGTQTHGDDFFLNVKPHERNPPVSAAVPPDAPSMSGSAAVGDISAQADATQAEPPADRTEKVGDRARHT